MIYHKFSIITYIFLFFTDFMYLFLNHTTFYIALIELQD